MKTKELVSELKELGYFVDRKEGGLSSEYLAISTADNYLIATISEKYPSVLNTDIYKGYNDNPGASAVLRMLIEYSMTPLDEREDTNKYLVHLFPGEEGYLNLDISSDDLALTDRYNTVGYHTEFTEKEYKELQNKYPQWLPKFDKDDPRFIEVQDGKNSEPMTKVHDSELMYPDEEFIRTYSYLHRDY